MGANLAVVRTVSVPLSDFPAAGPRAGQSICRLGPVGCRGKQGAPAEDSVLGELPVPGFFCVGTSGEQAELCPASQRSGSAAVM